MAAELLHGTQVLGFVNWNKPKKGVGNTVKVWPPNQYISKIRTVLTLTGAPGAWI